MRYAAATAILLAWLAASSFAGQSDAPAANAPTQQQPPNMPQRVRVSTAIASGMLVKKVNPKYPKDARKQRIQGQVSLRVRISREGDVVDLSVVNGDPALTQAAIDAVKQWKFKPFLLNGEAMEVETQLLINFTLSGS